MDWLEIKFNFEKSENLAGKFCFPNVFCTRMPFKNKNSNICVNPGTGNMRYCKAIFHFFHTYFMTEAVNFSFFEIFLNRLSMYYLCLSLKHCLTGWEIGLQNCIIFFLSFHLLQNFFFEFSILIFFGLCFYNTSLLLFRVFLIPYR